MASMPAFVLGHLWAAQTPCRYILPLGLGGISSHFLAVFPGSAFSQPVRSLKCECHGSWGVKHTPRNIGARESSFWRSTEQLYAQVKLGLFHMAFEVLLNYGTKPALKANSFCFSLLSLVHWLLSNLSDSAMDQGSKALLYPSGVWPIWWGCSLWEGKYVLVLWGDNFIVSKMSLLLRVLVTLRVPNTKDVAGEKPKQQTQAITTQVET